MRNLVNIPTLLASLVFLSCEEVVDVDLSTEDPRLVVEASINWSKDTDGKHQRITLSQTTPYFETGLSPATGAIVYIENAQGQRYDFNEEANSGIYTTDHFNAQENMSYTLFIQYKDQLYQGKEAMVTVTDLTYITQNDGTVFSREYVEIKAYFDDPVDEVNYYFYKFEAEKDHTINVIEDRLLNGNEMFAIFVSEELEKSDQVQVSLYGISRQYYNYMYTLITQSGESMGPFVTQPATVKGNIINTSNPENYALGYFRVSQNDTYIYVVD
ncbi:DUF4249 domain-containing protein [Galbibacter sp.]|uniref:DUF4249 domain-containing protein n=1 Tax=Galbibacter sp. TaxID=2918471 RepID=UPI002C7F6285|nr:DUF4249 domain-containing protein [Galbibacter sp.]HLV62533.1 DUF4249 domain-containing protein [Galbibacter sp.]